ncbi:unnamed protein product [Notodromas monacha]|uniref:Uncharacterized protein n=1 Tax=Notodromas monacha TaxID=399045 RepID=A0A7R9BK16_9CRUS|nr:unnamed protein product [Notodromas monacha]CAG0916128.1 unnamed protein product [Notodromas monacha]
MADFNGLKSKKDRQASPMLVFGGCLSFVAGLLLIMSFASPYWLQSWSDTNTSFKNMGLWEFCFDGFRYPKFQYDEKFTGCHYVFSEKYRIIREWLLPELKVVDMKDDTVFRENVDFSEIFEDRCSEYFGRWLMVVQAFVSLALIPSFGAQILLSLVVTRFPLFLMRQEWALIGLAAAMEAIVAPCLFLAVSIFGGMCYNRSWLLYPNFNFLSWSYAFCVFSMALHGVSALILYVEMKRSKDRHDRSKSLTVQMQPGPSGSSYI